MGPWNVRLHSFRRFVPWLVFFVVLVLALFLPRTIFNFTIAHTSRFLSYGFTVLLYSYSYVRFISYLFPTLKLCKLLRHVSANDTLCFAIEHIDKNFRTFARLVRCAARAQTSCVLRSAPATRPSPPASASFPAPHALSLPPVLNGHLLVLYAF